MVNLYVFIGVFIIGIILFFTCHKPSISTFYSNKPGMNILLVAGTHGNEISGTTCLLLFKHMLKNNNSVVCGRSFLVVEMFLCLWW